jgi:hypothetical protein
MNNLPQLENRLEKLNERLKIVTEEGRQPAVERIAERIKMIEGKIAELSPDKLSNKKK